MITINKMHHRLTIFRPTIVASDDGFGSKKDFIADGDVWAEFLRLRIIPSVIAGSGEAVSMTQGIKIRPRTINKGWRVSEGAHVYKVLHVDESMPGELILTTKEVDT